MVDPLPRRGRGATDYGRTHFSDEASGYRPGRSIDCWKRPPSPATGPRPMRDCGSCGLCKNRFDLGVPRGPKPGRYPCTRPTSSGSAYLVKAFALGYELTGDTGLLDAARYWAWTGVPFVYLVNPTGSNHPGTGRAVRHDPRAGRHQLGRAQLDWSAGAVVRPGLRRRPGSDLARLDPDGPWANWPKASPASGILQTYPMDHPHHGLLPDSFNLLAQSRNPSDINPGTLQPLAFRLLAGASPRGHALPVPGLPLQRPVESTSGW